MVSSIEFRSVEVLFVEDLVLLTHRRCRQGSPRFSKSRQY